MTILVSNYRIQFGKHKGKLLGDVVANDIQWILWLVTKPGGFTQRGFLLGKTFINNRLLTLICKHAALSTAVYLRSITSVDDLVAEVERLEVLLNKDVDE